MANIHILDAANFTQIFFSEKKLNTFSNTHLRNRFVLLIMCICTKVKMTKKW